MRPQSLPVCHRHEGCTDSTSFTSCWGDGTNGCQSGKHGHLHPSHTAGQEQTPPRSPSAQHALSALPPAAWAPFSWGQLWGQLWWQWHGLPAGSPSLPPKGRDGGLQIAGAKADLLGLDLASPNLKAFLLREPLTGAMQPMPTQTQRGRDRGARGSTGGTLAFLETVLPPFRLYPAQMCHPTPHLPSPQFTVRAGL